jgi:23S rRNA pseudouridine1911/1915/1917 synthase
MQIKKLFENKHLLVLDKPAGFVVHPSLSDNQKGKEKVPSVTEYILKKFPKLKGVGEDQGGVARPGIVHRLDKDTSGCLIVAKTQTDYENLKNQFQNKKVKKEYVALVWGDLKYDTGIITDPIARSKSDFRKKEVVKVTSSHGEKHRGEERDALTRYKVVKRENLFGEKVTLVTFYPETGRTHQIRIHAKSIGHPIVGDHLYGFTKQNFEKKFFGKMPVRQLLHSKSISFHNPHDGELLKIESPLPKDFKNIKM